MDDLVQNVIPIVRRTPNDYPLFPCVAHCSHWSQRGGRETCAAGFASSQGEECPGYERRRRQPGSYGVISAGYADEVA